jgi:hypothetical protein
MCVRKVSEYGDVLWRSILGLWKMGEDIRPVKSSGRNKDLREISSGGRKETL